MVCLGLLSLHSTCWFSWSPILPVIPTQELLVYPQGLVRYTKQLYTKEEIIKENNKYLRINYGNTTISVHFKYNSDMIVIIRWNSNLILMWAFYRDYFCSNLFQQIEGQFCLVFFFDRFCHLKIRKLTISRLIIPAGENVFLVKDPGSTVLNLHTVYTHNCCFASEITHIAFVTYQFWGTLH